MEIIKLILFFFKAMSIACALWFLYAIFKKTPKHDEDTIGALLFLVVFATCVYAWWL